MLQSTGETRSKSVSLEFRRIAAGQGKLEKAAANRRLSEKLAQKRQRTGPCCTLGFLRLFSTNTASGPTKVPRNGALRLNGKSRHRYAFHGNDCSSVPLSRRLQIERDGPDH